MARKYSGNIRVSSPLSITTLQRKLLDIIDDKETMREVHRMLGERCNEYVPMKTGQLRESMKAYPQSVRWETPYAHYQYEGEVYGPNFPGLDEGAPSWRSPRGKGSKYPTGRELGQDGFALLRPMWQLTGGQYTRPEAGILADYVFGYTTPDTSHHWLDRAMKNGGLRNYSIAVTNMLKRRAKELNKHG